MPWSDGTLRDFSVYNMSWTWRLACGVEAWGHDGLVIGHYAMSYHAPAVDRHVSYGDNLAFFAPPGNTVDQLRQAFWPAVLCGEATPPASLAPDRTAIARSS